LGIIVWQLTTHGERLYFPSEVLLDIRNGSAPAFTDCLSNAASRMALDLIWNCSRAIVECFFRYPKSCGTFGITGGIQLYGSTVQVQSDVT
jgi:hypothetical protein